MLSIGLLTLASGCWAQERPPHPDWRLIRSGPSLNTRWMSPEQVKALAASAGPHHGIRTPSSTGGLHAKAQRPARDATRTPFMDVTRNPAHRASRPPRPPHRRAN
eukprot:gene4919-5060_t